MSILNSKNLKTLAFVCVTSASLVVSQESWSRALEMEEISPITRMAAKPVVKSQASQLEVDGKRYNLVGVSLFKGDGAVSNLIKVATLSSYSHAGLILSDAEDENKWYSFESTGLSDWVHGGKYPHVRISEWDGMVKDYSGRVDYRLFVFDETRDRVATKDVTNFVDAYDGQSYTKNPFKLLGSLLNLNSRWKSKKGHNVFCSEMVAQMMMDLDLLKKSPAANYVPRDLSKKHLALAQGVELTPVFMAK